MVVCYELLRRLIILSSRSAKMRHLPRNRSGNVLMTRLAWYMVSWHGWHRNPPQQCLANVHQASSEPQGKKWCGTRSETMTFPVFVVDVYLELIARSLLGRQITAS